jgi:CubicO group peptidase (beta-lactamase class C family)
MRIKRLTSFTALIFSSSLAMAQADETSKLFVQLKTMDSLLFEEGFNKCNLRIVDSIVSDDFEFYHDQNGIQDKPLFLKGFKESLCSDPDIKPIRKLVVGTLTVFPLSNEGIVYGAIQNGVHEFYIREPNKKLYKTSVAPFTSLWLIEEGEWLLKRVLSYNHQSPKEEYGERFDADFPEPLFTTEDEILALLEQHKIPSVTIGYIDQGALKQIRVFGEKIKGIPADINTIYKVASLTKPIVAILTLKLAEKGLWDLNEPLANFYIDSDIKDSPELNKLTTKHVLSHRSGFPNWRGLTDANLLTFEFEPGTKFQYSGEGYEYLRKALEVKFKKGIEELARELLFDQLEMNDTHFTWDETMDEEDYAVEHDGEGAGIEVEKYVEANAAANLLTTATDYGRFMVYIMNGAGLSDSLYHEFLTPYSNKKEGIDWGLGTQLLFDLDGNEEFAIMHGGGDYGLKTIMLMLPKSKKGLLIFSN